MKINLKETKMAILQSGSESLTLKEKLKESTSKKNRSHRCLRPLWDPNMMTFRGMDFSESLASF